MTVGMKKLFRDMDDRLGEEKRSSRAVAFLKDLEKGPRKPLRLFFIFSVSLAGKFASGTDGGHGNKMFGDFPINIDVGENRLTSAGNSLLGKLKNKHLCQLSYLGVAHPFNVGGKKKVDRIPSDCARKVALQRSGKLDEVSKQHLRMFCRFCHGK